MFIDMLIAPFANYQFMQLALLACFCLSLSAAPLGVLLVLRRMSLTGDAIAHGILPGIALAYAYFGLSLWAMAAGGLIAGLILALITHLLSRFTQIKEDGNLAVFYLTSLAIGVVLISALGSPVDLLHILFGNILSLTPQTVFLLGSISSLSLIILAVFYRLIIISSFDPNFYRTRYGWEKLTTGLFMILVVLNMVASFYALGTLLAVALMILPAIISRFWVSDVQKLLLASVPIAFLMSLSGLLFSYHFDIPTGPCIVLCGAIMFIFSLLFGKIGSLLQKLIKPKHLEA